MNEIKLKITVEGKEARGVIKGVESDFLSVVSVLNGTGKTGVNSGVGLLPTLEMILNVLRLIKKEGGLNELKEKKGELIPDGLKGKVEGVKSDSSVKKNEYKRIDIFHHRADGTKGKDENSITPFDAVKKEISFWEKALEMSVGASEETKSRIRSQIEFYKSELDRLSYEVNGLPSVPERIFDYEDDLMARLNMEDVMLENIDLMDQFVSSSTLGLLKLVDVTDAFKSGFDAAAQGLASAGAESIKIFKNANSVLEQFIETLIKATAQSLIFKAVNSMVDLALPGIGSFFKGVLGLASGAVVTRPTLAVVGEGGEPEGVFPLSYLDNMMSTRPQVVYVQMEPVELKARGMDLRSVLKQAEHKVRKSR